MFSVGPAGIITIVVVALLVFGFAFEFPVLLFAAAAMGVVVWRTPARGRRWAVPAIVAIGAVVTLSGDPLTLLLSVPMYVLYELDIRLIRSLIRK